MNESYQHENESEELAVSSYMRELAANSLEDPEPLPGPGRIWWKAQLLEKRDAARRALLPLRLFRRGVAAALLLGFVFTITANWPEVSGWLSSYDIAPLTGAGLCISVGVAIAALALWEALASRE